MATKKKSNKSETDTMAMKFMQFKADQLTLIGKDHELAKQWPDLYDEARFKLPVPANLKSSIASMGVLQAIRVWKLGEQYIVGFGNQRVKAAALLLTEGKEVLIPAFVKDFDPLTSIDEMRVETLVENLARTDDTPDVKAVKAYQLSIIQTQDSKGQPVNTYPMAKIAELFSYSQPQMHAVVNTGKLLCSVKVPGLQQALRDGKISLTAAAEFSKGDYLQTDEAGNAIAGKYDRDKITKAFEELLAATPSGGKIKVEQAKAARTGNGSGTGSGGATEDGEASKKGKRRGWSTAVIKEVVADGRTPLAVVLALQSVLGEIEPDAAVNALEINGQDAGWYKATLEVKSEPVVEPKPVNPKGAGRKKKAKGEATQVTVEEAVATASAATTTTVESTS